MVEREKERATHTEKKNTQKKCIESQEGEGSMEIIFEKIVFHLVFRLWLSRILVSVSLVTGLSQNTRIFNNFCSHKNTLHIHTSRQVL